MGADLDPHHPDSGNYCSQAPKTRHADPDKGELNGLV
jgi:hypothetical protein